MPSSREFCPEAILNIILIIVLPIMTVTAGVSHKYPVSQKPSK